MKTGLKGTSWYSGVPKSASPWTDEQVGQYASALDAMMDEKMAKVCLHDLLWRLKPRILRALRRGHTAVDIHEMFQRVSPTLEVSYGTVARAVRKFRAENHLDTAYKKRKSKIDVAGGQQVASVPTQTETPRPPQAKVIPEAAKVPPQSTPSPTTAEKSVVTHPPTPQNDGDRLEAFLEALRPKAPKPGDDFRNCAERLRDDLRARGLLVPEETPPDKIK